MSSLKKHAIGIDLGTSHCCVGTWDDGGVEIIPGERIIPAYVSFSETEHLIGGAAKEQLTRNPCNTVYDVMKFIGKKL